MPASSLTEGILEIKAAVSFLRVSPSISCLLYSTTDWAKKKRHFSYSSWQITGQPLRAVVGWARKVESGSVSPCFVPNSPR